MFVHDPQPFSSVRSGVVRSPHTYDILAVRPGLLETYVKDFIKLLAGVTAQFVLSLNQTLLDHSVKRGVAKLSNGRPAYADYEEEKPNGSGLDLSRMTGDF